MPGPTTTGWLNFPSIGLGSKRLTPAKQAPKLVRGSASKISVARLNNQVHGDMIDKANALKGGSTPKRSAPSIAYSVCDDEGNPNQGIVKPCRHTAESCTCGRPLSGTSRDVTPIKDKIRRALNEMDMKHDPITGLRYPTALAALCPVCGMLHCVCGKNPDIVDIPPQLPHHTGIYVDGDEVIEWIKVPV